MISKKSLLPALLFMFCLNLASPAFSASRSGQVLAVESGTRITFTTNSGERRRVQLLGITTPLPDTSSGRISLRHLHMLLAGKFITVIYHSLTADGTMLGTVIHGGSNINLRMLESGLAQVAPGEWGNADTMEIFRKAQRRAQMRTLGLWQKRVN